MSVDDGTLEWFKKNLELIENGVASGKLLQDEGLSLLLFLFLSYL